MGVEDKLARPPTNFVLLAPNTRAKNQRGYLTYRWTPHTHTSWKQTSWKFHPDQERKLTRTVQISPKQKGFLEEFTALVWFNTPNSICPVTTYGKGGTRQVPADLKARGPTGSSAEQGGGQTGCPHQSSKKVPREGSDQELLRGQLRGGHFSTREQKFIGQLNPLDLQLMC